MCGKCNGYYHCYCDYNKMKEDLRIKEMEVELLKYKMKEYKERYPRNPNDGNVYG